MRDAGGKLGWSEEKFWNSTPAYFRAAMWGLAEFHGAAGHGDAEAMSADAYEALKRRVDGG